MDETLFLVAAAVAVGIAGALASRAGESGPSASDGSGGDPFDADAAAGDPFGVFQDAADPAGGVGVVSDDDNTQLPSFTDSIMAPIQNAISGAGVGDDQAAANTRAFLDMIAASEGTAGHGDNGYNLIFGGGTFASYADHPREFIPFTDQNGNHKYSSAAGRYQFLARTWDALRAKLALPDFSPASQDVAAIELIRERGALGDVQAGNVQAAITKCAPIWASLPGANYAQPERKLSFLVAAFTNAGGLVAA